MNKFKEYIIDNSIKIINFAEHFIKYGIFQTATTFISLSSTNFFDVNDKVTIIQTFVISFLLGGFGYVSELKKGDKIEQKDSAMVER